MSEKKCVISVEMRMIVDTIYPVGSYFWSSEDKDPATFLGGTWEQVKDRFILAAGDSYKAGATGGEAQHTLTVKEMPEHRHFSDSFEYGTPSSTKDTGKYITWVNHGTIETNKPVGGDDGPVRTSSAGRSQPHNNMPPYIVAYCWHRTA